MNADEAALRQHIEAGPGGFTAVDIAVELARVRAVRKLQHEVASQAALNLKTDLVPSRRRAHARRMWESCHALMATIKERRMFAVRNMSGLAPSAHAAALVLCLKDADKDIRLYAAETLSALGEPSAKYAKEALTRALEDTSGNVRHAAAVALGEMGELELECTKSLASRLVDEDVRVRRAAATTLGRTAKTAAPFASTIALALKDEDAPVRCATAETLGRSIGKPMLARTLSDSDAPWKLLV